MLKKLSIITIMAALIGCGANGAKKAMPEGYLKSLQFSTHGTMCFPTYYFSVDSDDDGSIWLTHISDEGDTTKVAVGRGLLYDLRDIIEKDGLYKLEKSYSPKMEVMDGDGWSFYAGFDSKESISSGGSNAWPKKISFGRLRALLDSTYQALTAKPAPEGIVTYYNYVRHDSSAEPTVDYEMTAKQTGKTGWKVTLKGVNPNFYLDGEPHYLEKTIDEATMYDVTRIFKSHQMYLYGNYPNPPDVLDGYSWHLEVKLDTGESFSSSGSNNGPDDNGIYLINQLFEGLSIDSPFKK